MEKGATKDKCCGTVILNASLFCEIHTKKENAEGTDSFRSKVCL